MHVKILELTTSEATGCGLREADQSDRIVPAADIGYSEEDAGVPPSPIREIWIETL